MENDDLADAVYLHFQEAFDKVWYQFFFKETKQVGDKKEGHGMETGLKGRAKRVTVNVGSQDRGWLQVQGSEMLKMIWKRIWIVRLRKFADTDYLMGGQEKIVEWLGNETGSEIQVMYRGTREEKKELSWIDV